MIVVIDIETTGLDPHRCRLLEIGAVAVTTDGLPPFDADWKIHPPPIELVASLGIDWTHEALAVNRLLPRMARGEWKEAITEREALDNLRAFVGDATIAYWSPFDGACLDAAARRCGVVRPMWSYRSVDLRSVVAWTSGTLRAQSLVGTLERLGLDPIPDADRHTALGDARAAARILQHLQQQETP